MNSRVQVEVFPETIAACAGATTVEAAEGNSARLSVQRKTRVFNHEKSVILGVFIGAVSIAHVRGRPAALGASMPRDFIGAVL